MKIIRGILVVIFLAEGITKLIGMDFQVTAFTNWGYSLTFMYVIGSLELLGTIGLLMKPLRLFANIGLLAIMVGAFYTHISRNDPPMMMGLAIVATILLSVHLYKNLKGTKQTFFQFN